MKCYQLSDFTRGWFIGDFEPTLWQTKDFEVGVKTYQRGDREAKHCHLIACELTVIISGRFRMKNKILKAGDIVLLAPKEIVDFECLEDGANVIVKIPSIKKDKYLCVE